VLRSAAPSERPEVAPEVRFGRRPSLGGWDADDKHASQQFGDRWYDEQRSLALIVPSLTVPGLERNILINQRHPAFAHVEATRAAALVCHPRLLE